MVSSPATLVNPPDSVTITEPRSGPEFADPESLFARLAGLQMLALTGLRGRSAPEDVSFLFARLLADASSVFPEQRELLTAIGKRAQPLAKLRDPDQRINLARLLIGETRSVLSDASGGAVGATAANGTRRPRLNLRGFGTTWIVVALVLLAVLGARLAYNPLFVGRFIYPHHNQRLQDLRSLRIALQAYRTKTGQFPVSADSGTSWNGVEWATGSGGDWLPGLVPTYIPTLPHDPRNNTNRYNQYVYKSNGADYKLLSLVPEDCEFAVANKPSLSDPARNVFKQCYAYGYWTPAAVAW